MDVSEVEASPVKQKKRKVCTKYFCVINVQTFQIF